MTKRSSSVCVMSPLHNLRRPRKQRRHRYVYLVLQFLGACSAHYYRTFLMYQMLGHFIRPNFKKYPNIPILAIVGGGTMRGGAKKGGDGGGGGCVGSHNVRAWLAARSVFGTFGERFKARRHVVVDARGRGGGGRCFGRRERMVAPSLLSSPLPSSSSSSSVVRRRRRRRRCYRRHRRLCRRPPSPHRSSSSSSPRRRSSPHRRHRAMRRGGRGLSSRWVARRFRARRADHRASLDSRGGAAAAGRSESVSRCSLSGRSRCGAARRRRRRWRWAMGVWGWAGGGGRGTGARRRLRRDVRALLRDPAGVAHVPRRLSRGACDDDPIPAPKKRSSVEPRAGLGLAGARTPTRPLRLALPPQCPAAARRLIRSRRHRRAA